jgi:hypothetical protein
MFDPRFRGDLYLAVVSERLGSKSPREWILDHTDSHPLGSCYSDRAGGIGNRFQGNPAWFQECHEPTGGGGHIVIFATPARGNITFLHVADEPSLQAIYDGNLFSHEGGVLETVELRPEDALEAVNPSESPQAGRRTVRNDRSDGGRAG